MLEENENEFTTNVIGLLTQVKREIYTPPTVLMTPDQVAEKGTNALKSIANLNETTLKLFKTALDSRKTKLETSKHTILLVVILSNILIWLISFISVRNFVQTIKNIVITFAKIGEGEFRNTIDLKKNDELGDLLRGLFNMQINLNINISETKERAIKSTRIQQALDNTSSSVMLANNQFEVIYINQALQSLFVQNEADIRQAIHEFNANNILGLNIEQLGLTSIIDLDQLTNLNTTYQNEFVLGSNYFKITINPVIDTYGTRIGTVIEWLDRTLEFKIEQEIAKIVAAVKAGELSNRINLSDKSGFFLKLSSDINEFSDVIENVFNEIGHTMQSLAEGDLTKTISSNYQGEYLKCKNAVNESLFKLTDIVKNIKHSSEIIYKSSHDIAEGNDNLSQRAELQAASLEETAASMTELTSTVKNNSDNAQHANELADDARKMAKSGGDIVNSAILAMHDINDSSSKLAAIIEVIDEIAFQTNLLALNASVEAARAGEQGRGFSVVATEVRNLAKRSAMAAKESKDLIQNSVNKVQTGRNYVNETGKALTEILARVNKVSDIVAEIAAGSLEQTTGINQVNQTVIQMDEITQQNAVLAEHTSEVSKTMSNLSSDMAKLLGFFKT